MFSLNSPLIDRSDRVEKLRYRLFGVLQIVLTTALATAFLAVGFKLCAFFLHLTLQLPGIFDKPEGFCCFALTGFLIITSVVCLYYICQCLTSRVAFFITAVVSTCVDTYEKRSQNNATPQEKFINKYQRMERHLAYLQELYHRDFHREFCPGGDCLGSVNVDNRVDDTFFEKIERALRQADRWYERIMLSLCHCN